MAKNFNYRKYYKEYYGIDFGPEYHIHHMDFDKSNNDISNLLLLPGKLHGRYHFLINGLNGMNGEINMDFKIEPNGYGIHMFPYNAMMNLCEVMKEINKWVEKKAIMENNKYYKEQGII